MVNSTAVAIINRVKSQQEIGVRMGVYLHFLSEEKTQNPKRLHQNLSCLPPFVSSCSHRTIHLS